MATSWLECHHTLQYLTSRNRWFCYASLRKDLVIPSARYASIGSVHIVLDMGIKWHPLTLTKDVPNTLIKCYIIRLCVARRWWHISTSSRCLVGVCLRLVAAPVPAREGVGHPR